METGKIEGRSHRITIEGRERICITGVEDVDSFNENEVILKSVMGMITVCGEDLHIAKFNLEEGILSVDGKILTVDYADHEEQRAAKNGVLARMFR